MSAKRRICSVVVLAMLLVVVLQDAQASRCGAETEICATTFFWACTTGRNGVRSRLHAHGRCCRNYGLRFDWYAAVYAWSRHMR